jgi:hypothetical protein
MMSIWNYAAAIKESLATTSQAIFLGTDYATVNEVVNATVNATVDATVDATVSEAISNPGFWANLTGWGMSLLSTAYSYMPNVMNFIPSSSVVSNLPSIALSAAQSNPYAAAGIAVSPAMLDVAKAAANKLGYVNAAAYIPAPMTATVNGTVAATKTAVATVNGISAEMIHKAIASRDGIICFGTAVGTNTVDLLKKTPSLIQSFRRGSELSKGIDQELDDIIERALPYMGPDAKRVLIAAINFFFGRVLPLEIEALVKNEDFRAFVCDKDATGQIDPQNRLAAVQRFLPAVELLPEIAAEFRKDQAVYDVVSRLPAETLALLNSAGEQGGIKLAKAFILSKDTKQKGRTVLAIAQDHSPESQAQLQGLIGKMATANKIDLSGPSSSPSVKP